MSLNHFISKELYLTSFLLDVKCWQMHNIFASALLPNLLLRMRRNGHVCTSGLNIESRFCTEPEFLPILQRFEPFWPLFGALAQKGPYFHIKFDPRFANFVPICYREILELGPRFQLLLINLLLRMRRNGQNYTSGYIKPETGNPHGLFPIPLRILVALTPRFMCY